MSVELGARLAAGAADEAQWKRFAATLPPGMNERLAAIEPWKMPKEARAGFVTGAQAELKEVGETLGTQAEAKAISAVEAGLANAQTQAFTAIDALGLAVKRSFADAMVAVYRAALGLAALAFLLTVFLPQLTLRKTRRGPAPVAE